MTQFSNQVAGLKSDLTAARSQLEKANAVNDKLASRVQELLKRENNAATALPEKKTGGLVGLFGGDGTNGMSEAMGKMVKAAIEQQLEAKIAGMMAKLNLTPDQEKAVRAIMEKQMSSGIESPQKMFKGELSADEVEKMGKGTKSEEAQIKELLTPEQVAAYDVYQTEEKTRMARLMANSEMMQMQASLQLTEEQQDKAFAVLAEQTLGQLNVYDGNPAGAGDFWKRQFEKKAEALQGVLTPEQLERYRKFQEQQMKMYEALMPKGATNGHIQVTPMVMP